MTADEPNPLGEPVAAAQHRELLAQAREKCRRLMDDLRRDAVHLQAHRPSALVPAEVLAEGRELFARAAAAAEALLRQLEQSPHDEPPTAPSPSDSQ